MYKPAAGPFSTVVRVQNRTETEINGAPEIGYTNAEPALAFCSWKSKGGTENTSSGSLVVEDTAEAVLWFRPDVSERDRLLLGDDATLAYEVVNVENVEMRNQYLILKVRRAVSA